MASLGYQITAPLPGGIPEGISFSNTQRAVFEAGQHMQAAWAALARAKIGERTGAYIQGIEADGSMVYPFDGDALSVAVFNRAKHAWVIEEGSEAFNLASRIQWGGGRHHRSKSTGRWYIRVPFRHYTTPRAGEGGTRARAAKAMPGPIHMLAKGMVHNSERLTFQHGAAKTSRKTVIGRSGPIAVRGRGAKGGRVTEVTDSTLRFQHGQPRRKSAASLAAAVDIARRHGRAMPRESHSTPLYEGLRKSGSVDPDTGERHNQYMTWRVLHEQSDWTIPAKAGKFLARSTMMTERKTVADSIADGFRRDIEAAIAQALGGGG